MAKSHDDIEHIDVAGPSQANLEGQREPMEFEDDGSVKDPIFGAMNEGGPNYRSVSLTTRFSLFADDSQVRTLNSPGAEINSRSDGFACLS